MKKGLVFLGIITVLIAFAVSCGSSPSGTATTAARQAGQPIQDGRAASGYNGVVSAAKPEASDVGIQILRMGGNAVDAAVAVGFAMGVVEPEMNGLGGGGFMLLKVDGMEEAVFIDFREIAPSASTRDMYLGPDGNTVVFPGSTARTHVVGGLAAGIPGEAAGLHYAWENYGSGNISWQQILQPAIDLARNGYIVTQNFHNGIMNNIDKLNLFPYTASIYTDDGLPWDVGVIIRNTDLANTLEAIAERGPSAFYTGPIAQAVVDAANAAGGIFSMADMANYRVSVRTPVVGTYRDYTIISAPPPSSGGTAIIQILNILENIPSNELRFGTTRTINAWIQAYRLAFADRNTYMADTDFVHVPLIGMSSKAYARDLFRQMVNLDTAMISANPGNPDRYESGNTTSFSVMDSAGNMVTVTKTINYVFGSGVGVPGVGIILNNEMDDFVSNNPAHPNAPEPNKKPLSSMSPTMVLDPQGRPFMTLGTPGATRIITTLAAVISHVIDNDMTIQQAIELPRLFASNTGAVLVESRMPYSTINNLQEMGYTLTINADYASTFGGVHGVLFNHDSGRLYGGADPRRDGEARAF